MRESKLEHDKFAMLQPRALASGIDPGGDYFRPGNGAAERGFQLLKCGYDMLLTVADNAFPVLDRRTRKRGGKWIRQGMLFYGIDGSTMFANAAPKLLAELDGRLIADEPAELSADQHMAMYETVRSFHPLRKMISGFMEHCLYEFTVIKERKPRPRVANGHEPPNEYSQALMRGENPDDDPELVAMQRVYARDYFIDQAISWAIKQSLHPNDRGLLEKKFVRFFELNDSDAAEFRERALRGWIEGSKSYLEYARLDNENQ